MYNNSSFNYNSIKSNLFRTDTRSIVGKEITWTTTSSGAYNIQYNVYINIGYKS